MKYRKIIVLLLAMIFCLSGCGQQNGDKKKESIKNDLIRDKNARIMIHTYSGDTYLASGELNVANDNGGQGELNMELKGTLKIQNHLSDSLEKETKDMDTASGKASSLTVYTEEDVYGFYSHRQPFQINVDGEEQTVFYGYLEGSYQPRNGIIC